MSDEIRKLSDEEVDQIADKVLDKISKHGLLASERHWNEHEWLKRYMESKVSNQNRRQQIIDRLVGTVGVAVTLGFLTWVGHAMLMQAAAMIKKLTP